MNFPKSIATHGMAASACAILAFMSLPESSRAQAEQLPTGQASTQSAETCFAAKTLLTDDPDWQSKWDAPGDTATALTSVHTLNIGDKATLILLFSCPSLVEEKARIECDIKMTAPDGEIVLQQGAIPCYDAVLTRPREDTHLAEIWLDFDVTREDGIGLVEFRLGLTDRNAGERLSLTLPVTFTGKTAE